MRKFSIIIYSFFILKPGFAQTTGIACHGNTFWATSNYSLYEFELNGSSVTSTISPVSNCPGHALAFCNNVNGGAFSPTFYTDDSTNHVAYYYNGHNWVAGTGSSSNLIYNAGGSGNYLYFHDQNSSRIERYDGNSFTTIYNDTSLKMLGADITVDDNGNAWVMRGTTYTTATYVDAISPAGVLLHRYSISLSILSNYGTMMLNGVLYLGFGNGNPDYPGQLLPISFSGNTATKGSPITMPSYSFNDLASCSAGAPVLTGETEVQADEITVYPNPLANGNWQLKVKEDLIGAAIEVVDFNGRLIYQSLIQNTKQEIELKISSGVYLLRISSATGTSVRKLIRL